MAEEKQNYELGGGQLAYKINWNDLILYYCRECARFYAMAHTNREVFAPVYISWVKNLNSILIPYLDDKYDNDLKENLQKLAERYEEYKLSKKWAEFYETQFEIDKFFTNFECLMRVIKREGFLQTKGVTIPFDPLESD